MFRDLSNSMVGSVGLHDNIALIHLYVFVTASLTKFPAIFNIDEEMKGFFTHVFNGPEFWNYVGPIPHSQYSNPDTFAPSKRVEFFTWYNEQEE